VAGRSYPLTVRELGKAWTTASAAYAHGWLIGTLVGRRVADPAIPCDDEVVRSGDGPRGERVEADSWSKS
jgi:hypothetical protein